MRNGLYELVMAPEDYPGYKYRGRYMYEHHLVWWRNTGEVVTGSMLIHHKNDQKRDNRFENLEKKTRAAHTRDHNSERPRKHPKIVKLACAFCKKDFEITGNQWLTRKRYKYNHCSRRCSVKHQMQQGLHRGKKKNLHIPA